MHDFQIGGFQLPFIMNGIMCGIVAIVVLLLPDITPKKQKVEISKGNIYFSINTHYGKYMIVTSSYNYYENERSKFYNYF